MSSGRIGYAGIDKRFAAILIDGIILNILYLIITGKSYTQLSANQSPGEMLVQQFIWWMYFTLLESSSMQGTIGKRVLGIIVTDLQGNKISFGKATARTLAKLVAFLLFGIAIVLGGMTQNTTGDKSYYGFLTLAFLVLGVLVFIIGFSMAAYTPEKQALHDIIARCLVVNGRGQSNSIPGKQLGALAVAVLLSKGILALVPTPTTSTSIADKSTSESTPTPTTIPTPTPTTTPPQPPTQDNNFGELIPASPAAYEYTNGVHKLGFSAGIVKHEAVLSMSGASGLMIVQFSDGQGGTEMVGQEMTLMQSSKGLVIEGKNPIDLKTEKPHTTYAVDKFLISLQPNQPHQISFLNVSQVSSPVEAEFLGYPRIGIKMSLFSPNKQDKAVIITEVANDLPAAKAGLRPGDIIRSVNGKTVSNVSEVQSQILASLLFIPLKFEINRSGKNISFEIGPQCCVNQAELKQGQI